MREGFWGYLPVAAVIGGIIVLEMASVIWRSFGINGAAAPESAGTIGSTKALGMLIYTEYIYAFEIAAAVLLVAIIAAVALTLRKRKDIKYFDPADAVRVKRNDRLRIVKMKATARDAATTEATKEAQ
jgi:NADH-quinone oxidoreductase subunit J